jgi:hypothetical protein
VQQAGRPGAITIATNMAGRGTDIVLPAVSPDKVKEIRKAIKNRKDFYSPVELLQQHPDSQQNQ